MLNMGDKVIARGQKGTIIWIDPWDQNTVAVQFKKYVDEVASEDCKKLITIDKRLQRCLRSLMIRLRRTNAR
jgi:hypothetical protein